MLSILISILAGLAAGLATANYSSLSKGWCALAGSVVFLAASFLINRIFGKKLQAIFKRVQALLEAAQEEATKMVNRAQHQSRGGMSANLLQDNVEKVMHRAVQDAIGILDEARRFFNWALLSERQVSTYKMQLHFQLKNWDEVDKLMPKVLLWEPLTLAMKMTREYRKDSPKLAKTYRKGVRKFKRDKALLIYSLYAWILLKRKEHDKAQEVLTKAKEKTESEDLDRNWQAVVNNRPQQFSNHFLGEQWYALHLEEQKPAKHRVSKGEMKRNPMFGRGKRRFR